MKFEEKNRVIYCKNKYHKEYDFVFILDNKMRRYFKGYLVHRVNGPAEEYSNGNKEWYVEGVFHREDGPAVESYNGTKKRYIKGELHREDGPAVEWSYGDNWWFLNGRKYTEEEYKRIIVVKKLKEY